MAQLTYCEKPGASANKAYALRSRKDSLGLAAHLRIYCCMNFIDLKNI